MVLPACTKSGVPSTSATVNQPLLISIPDSPIVDVSYSAFAPGVQRAPAVNPEYQVPIGTKLLSHNCPVTSSDKEPIIGSFDMLTDGVFGHKEDIVEYSGGARWVQVDLQQDAKITAIGIWRNGMDLKRVIRSMRIEISRSPDFDGKSVVVFNNGGQRPPQTEHDDVVSPPYEDSRFGKVIVLKRPTMARFVRIFTDDADWTRFAELMVFGLEVNSGHQ